MDEFILTLDIDWAPDFVIDEVASLLKEKRVRATWFVTHESEAIGRLRGEPELFELGIHPNFLPGSSHGSTSAEVLECVKSLVPDAISIRTHSFVQSTPLLAEIATHSDVKIDSSLFLPGMHQIQPIEYWCCGKKMLRLPVFWEDDYEFELPEPNWSLTPLLKVSGLKVMNFHPIHVYLNSATGENYQRLKQQVPRLVQLVRDDVQPFIHKGIGTRIMFEEAVALLSAAPRSQNLRDVYLQWQDGWMDRSRTEWSLSSGFS